MLPVRESYRRRISEPSHDSVQTYHPWMEHLAFDPILPDCVRLSTAGGMLEPVRCHVPFTVRTISTSSQRCVTACPLAALVFSTIPIELSLPSGDLLASACWNTFIALAMRGGPCCGCDPLLWRSNETEHSRIFELPLSGILLSHSRCTRGVPPMRPATSAVGPRRKPQTPAASRETFSSLLLLVNDGQQCLTDSAVTVSGCLMGKIIAPCGGFNFLA